MNIEKMKLDKAKKLIKKLKLKYDMEPELKIDVLQGVDNLYDEEDGEKLLILFFNCVGAFVWRKNLIDEDPYYTGILVGMESLRTGINEAYKNEIKFSPEVLVWAFKRLVYIYSSNELLRT